MLKFQENVRIDERSDRPYLVGPLPPPATTRGPTKIKFSKIMLLGSLKTPTKPPATFM